MAAAGLTIGPGRAAADFHLTGNGVVPAVGRAAGILPVGVMPAPGLLGAPGKVHPGIRVDGCAVDIRHDGFRAEADGAGHAGGLGKNPIISQNAPNRHQAAHAGAGDAGTLPVGVGSVVPVDHGLDLIYDPFQRLISLHRQRPEGCGGSWVRQVLLQPLVANMAALHAHDDHLLVPAIQEGFQPPAFAVGSVAVIKQVVPVKEIHHRVALAGLVVILRQINVQGTV